ncbi:hypothetical protein J2S43_006672 [Catenuloplanes nepalensis]|uniref:Uncharacterized protein n=1 Tax=Catenuloplanes nepalensis TaxID=587533 RepID=A0ABT9N379_9ACTN|nr:hypothetical protein [Catenuloplanes nepalensis]MDP9798160.1 hypothetical protein [Catenuloplanes nepalensis]
MITRITGPAVRSAVFPGTEPDPTFGSPDSGVAPVVISDIETAGVRVVTA